MPVTRSFILIGVIILLWNLTGVAFFIMQYTADLTELAKTDPDTARAFATMPAWSWLVYAIAVGSGTIGAILLLMRRALAAPFFLLSVVAIVIQFGHTFLATDLLAVKGWTAAIFPAVIFAIGVAQWLYARELVARRVLH
jgi:hypothetical protein